MTDFRERLEQYLHLRGRGDSVEQLTPDASTREYFRIRWNDSTAIACVYPDAFTASEQTYLDVTNLFLKSGLPVAEILDFDETLGVIVQEDLGDRILRDTLVESDDETCERLIDEAITMIAKIQAATDRAFELNSIASRLRFDTEKLLWELEFFKTHYFTTYKNEPLPPETDAALTRDFLELSRELESRAKVLCHRDFHAANVMLDAEDRLRIIDHQDARMGSVAYDLVSLLLDRVTVPPSPDWLAGKRRLLLSERERVGLAAIDEAEFADEFRLQTIQRCLKATGTFSFQSVNRGKTYFVPFIKPMFEIVFRATQKLDKFGTLREVVRAQLG